jgi:hypothetical protein
VGFKASLALLLQPCEESLYQSKGLIPILIDNDHLHLKKLLFGKSSKPSNTSSLKDQV